MFVASALPALCASLAAVSFARGMDAQPACGDAKLALPDCEAAYQRFGSAKARVKLTENYAEENYGTCSIQVHCHGGHNDSLPLPVIEHGGTVHGGMRKIVHDCGTRGGSIPLSYSCDVYVVSPSPIPFNNGTGAGPDNNHTWANGGGKGMGSGGETTGGTTEGATSENTGGTTSSSESVTVPLIASIGASGFVAFVSVLTIL